MIGRMLANLVPFLIHWAITAVSLWVASHIFRGLKFDSTGALIVAALLLGFANAIVKPLLIVLTLPLTLLTFGLFLLVINALMILLVAALGALAGGAVGAAAGAATAPPPAYPAYPPYADPDD